MVDCSSCFATIERHESDFLYLDPPTWRGGRMCYGDSDAYLLNFNHIKLRNALEHHDNWVMTIDNAGPIESLYSNKKFVVEHIESAYKSRRGHFVIYPATLPQRS